MFTLSNIKFNDILAINKLEIKARKITCIIGKSGSGKTTLLKLLNNILTADSGSLKYKGQEITNYNPLKLRREITMLPQNPIMFADTIKNNFAKTMEYTENKEINEERYIQALRQVGLKHELKMEAQQLSGGEKQRLALARILLLEPEVLLLDEPSSSLDENTEDILIQMVINYIKEKKGTLIMVTHSQSIANKYGEVIISLAKGKIQKIEHRR
ncbi:ATP-binding cassette domain-containing protein [Fuchsiella alkaliacetigena]|uniref:ATP-binding cassette domain-containing protein n=1 Tax=Fuchsiella alkaliacetigena TaxID=957042 RepID=UPI00200A18D0|nr:ATP-binding cassette domain-containing protein [Fuchsiella alkaliacetigena]MCK8825852.1 ATP-binding cassette domain-containing protein [Fuchsiella alkaliacetigena]